MIFQRWLRRFSVQAATVSLLLLAGCQPLDGSAVLGGGDPLGEADLVDGGQPLPPTPEQQLVAAGEAPPVQLLIPALSLEIPVVPMGWERVMGVAGQLTTRWVVPADAAGWALNSSPAGGDGNVIVAGHQAYGAAVFAAISLGELAVGQELYLVDGAGRTFLYRIVELPDPIPLLGATAEEAAQAALYSAPTQRAQLTLMTGWPLATTTHRLFVVAERVTASE